MSYPKVYRDLLGNEGAGPLLREDIIPNKFVKVTAQSLTADQKIRARTNIGAVSPTDNVASSSGTLVHFAGNFAGRSIGELKQELKNFIYASEETVTNKVFVFSAFESFITYWNNNSGTLTAGSQWEVIITCSKVSQHWATLLFTSYIQSAFVIGIMQDGEFRDLQLVSCKKWLGTLDTASAVLIETWKSSDGLSWYRKWSNGLIEQVVHVSTFSELNKTVTLNKTMATTTYACHPMSVSAFGNDGYDGIRCVPTTTSRVTIVKSFSEPVAIKIYVVGY